MAMYKTDVNKTVREISASATSATNKEKKKKKKSEMERSSRVKCVRA